MTIFQYKEDRATYAHKVRADAFGDDLGEVLEIANRYARNYPKGGYGTEVRVIQDGRFWRMIATRDHTT